LGQHVRPPSRLDSDKLEDLFAQHGGKVMRIDGEELLRVPSITAANDRGVHEAEARELLQKFLRVCRDPPRS
jgi:hypothetical protein